MLGETKNGPLITIFTVLIQTLFISVVILEISTSSDLKWLKMFLPFATIVVLILAILVVLSINQIVDNAKKSTQAEILKTHLDTVDELINTLQAERHEYTRHVQTVQAMLFLDEVTAAKDYLDGVAKKYWCDEGLTYVGEPLLTGLIGSKRAMAASMGIDFAFAIKCNPRLLPIKPWDLCSVIGNLLDNAIEAVVQQEDSNRKVGLEIKEDDIEFTIFVYNTGPKVKNLDRIFTPGFTSKESSGRGYGLYIVKRIVDDCGGEIEVIVMPRTTFKVHLPKEVTEGVKTGKRSDRKRFSQAIGI